MLANLPVLGICGYKGVGKTTLIEQIIPRLTEKGLLVAAVKCCQHRVDIDTSGKDTDRLFRSGADIFLTTPQEGFFRVHTSNDIDFSYILRILCRYYDLVLVEGRKNIPFAKVWLESEPGNKRQPDVDCIIETLPRNGNRVDRLISVIDDWLPGQWAKIPVLGCVLIGGKSTRMGRPKHLIIENNLTWLEKKVAVLAHSADKVVIIGAGDIPERLAGIHRLPDVPDVQGPMAGILSAIRWAPYKSLVVTACDLPDLSCEAVEWLLSNRRPGTWAVFPRLSGSSNIEPLFAHYDFRAHSLLEKAAAEGNFSPAFIAASKKVVTVTPPEWIAATMKNYNTEEELRSRKRSVG